MGRVSLTEAYDDRSVIAKLNEMDKRVKENTTVVTAAEASAKQSAQAAQETADRFAGSVGAVVQNANAQINASKAQVDQAKAEVDETVTTVAQAVQTANQASASAQQSAQTVAGYDSRVTALETADGQNIKLTGNASVYGRKAFNAISTRNVNGQGDAASCLELFRFKAISGQDHRFNFFRNLGSGVCLTFLRVQIKDATVSVIDGSKTPIGTSTGNITIGAGFTADNWCVVYEKNDSSCVFCSLLSAFTGSRFPIKEANIDMSNQCNTVQLTDLSGIKEVTL